MSASSATYCYCLVLPGRSRPSRLPSGPPGTGRVRLLDAGGGLKLVVSDAPLDRYGEEAIAAGLKDLDWVARCAVAHERVIDRFLAARALLPMKLFTLFRDDERALAHVTRERRRVDRVLARVAGRLEWGLRAAWDPSRAPGAIAIDRPSSGAAFLVAKRQALAAVKDGLEHAIEAADQLHGGLADLADDARRRDLAADPPSLLVLDAAYLVPAKRRSVFERRARAVARRLEQSGCQVTITGPWPPYHFVDAGRP